MSKPYRGSLNIIERLEEPTPSLNRIFQDRRDAVAEIERLRALLRRYRTETPLGHQPHMIAHEVDAVLANSQSAAKD